MASSAKILMGFGAMIAIYSLIASESLLLILSVGVMILGVLWENRSLIEETQAEIEGIPIDRPDPNQPLDSWKIKDLEYELRKSKP